MIDTVNRGPNPSRSDRSVDDSVEDDEDRPWTSGLASTRVEGRNVPIQTPNSTHQFQARVLKPLKKLVTKTAAIIMTVENSNWKVSQPSVRIVVEV